MWRGLSNPRVGPKDRRRTADESMSIAEIPPSRRTPMQASATRLTVLARSPPRKTPFALRTLSADDAAIFKFSSHSVPALTFVAVHSALSTLHSSFCICRSRVPASAGKLRVLLRPALSRVRGRAGGGSLVRCRSRLRRASFVPFVFFVVTPSSDHWLAGARRSV